MKTSPHKNIVSVQWWTLSLRGLVLMALMTSLFANIGGVEAAPNMAWTSTWLRVTPSGSITLCEGEKKVFQVWAVQSEWGWGGGLAGQIVESYMAGQLVAAIVDNSQVGSIAPATQVTPGAASGIGTGGVQFVFKAKQIGRTEITFSDLAPSSTLPDETVSVEVKRCKYRVVVFSTWTIPDGFKPRMFSVLGADVEPDATGAFAPVVTPVENFARGLTPFACPVSMQAPDTEATITGQLDMSNGTLSLAIDYDPVPATVRVTCPEVAPGVSPIDEGEPRVLIPERLAFSGPAGGYSGNLPHILDAYMSVTGLSTLVVLAEPQP